MKDCNVFTQEVVLDLHWHTNTYSRQVFLRTHTHTHTLTIIHCGVVASNKWVSANKFCKLVQTGTVTRRGGVSPVGEWSLTQNGRALTRVTLGVITCYVFVWRVATSKQWGKIAAHVSWHMCTHSLLQQQHSLGKEMHNMIPVSQYDSVTRGSQCFPLTLTLVTFISWSLT